MSADAAMQPRVLLLHGLLSGPIVWAPVRAELAGQARFLAPDLLGYGSAQRPDSPYGLDAIVDHLEPVIRRFQPTHVIGHSMGAIVALALRARFPEQFSGVGTISIPVFASGEEGREYIGGRGQIIRMFLRNHRLAHAGCWTAARTRVTWERIANRVYPMQPPGIFRAMFHHCHEAHDAGLERVVFSNAVPELAEQPGPGVTAIHGTQDESAPYAPAAEVAERMGWRLYSIEGATHQLIVDQASLVARWVREEVLNICREVDATPAGEVPHPAAD